MNRDELCYKPVVELRRLLATRSISASELVRALLDRVEEVNGPINAIVALRAEVPSRMLKRRTRFHRPAKGGRWRESRSRSRT